MLVHRKSRTVFTSLRWQRTCPPPREHVFARRRSGPLCIFFLQQHPPTDNSQHASCLRIALYRSCSLAIWGTHRPAPLLSCRKERCWTRWENSQFRLYFLLNVLSHFCLRPDRGHVSGCCPPIGGKVLLWGRKVASGGGGISNAMTVTACYARRHARGGRSERSFACMVWKAGRRQPQRGQGRRF